jgi:hypothetical protein
MWLRVWLTSCGRRCLQAPPVLPKKSPPKKEVSTVVKHFLQHTNIRTRLELQQHRLAHEAELDALQCVLTSR